MVDKRHARMLRALTIRTRITLSSGTARVHHSSGRMARSRRVFSRWRSSGHSTKHGSRYAGPCSELLFSACSRTAPASHLSLFWFKIGALLHDTERSSADQV